MRKIIVSLILTLVLGSATNTSFANAEQYPLLKLFKGQALLIDMDVNDTVNRDTFVNGKDLLLVKLISIDAKDKNAPLQFKILGISNIQELIKLDINHNGLIEKTEMEKANIALLRYNKDGDISIDSLAHTLIKNIDYKQNKEGGYTVTVETNEGKHLKAYFIDI